MNYTVNYLELVVVLLHVLESGFEESAFLVSLGSNGLRKRIHNNKVRRCLTRSGVIQTLTYRSLREIPPSFRGIVVGGLGVVEVKLFKSGEA
jgi:hypothetical protein